MTENKIQFILNNQLTELTFAENLNSTTTLLQYLRNNTPFKGVKEGCAEGDCGACTVVISEFIDNSFQYKAVDSCLIFLPMLHGLSVYTVEFIETLYSDQYHPVQEALIAHNGSQCGFCTPGFTMSMFALHQQDSQADRNKIEDALSGNLCRCTGYQSIIEACLSDVFKNKNQQIEVLEQEQKILLESINTKESIVIKNLNQEYFKCFKKEEALLYLDKYPDTLILNGSTDVSLAVTKRHEHLQRILDISSVNELKKLVLSDEWIKIGAGVSLEKLKNFSENRLPILFQNLTVFASKQIREMGTIGGNVGSSSPISDLLPVLMVLEAELKLQSIKSDRLVNINDYVLGYRKTLRNQNELITKIHIPVPKIGVIHQFYKVSKRKDMDISTLSAAFELKLNGILVENIKICFGGMDAVAIRVHLIENFLIGKTWERNNIEQAQLLLDDIFNPISDARSSAEFRMIAAKNLLLKFWSENIV
ncbi:MAG: xanthine dehydrogenase small subunit [Flavobacteriia bacterium]|nr:xanthine dehydrogenase small subunit [Flavobacteriia bacterium]